MYNPHFNSMMYVIFESCLKFVMCVNDSYSNFVRYVLYHLHFNCMSVMLDSCLNVVLSLNNSSFNLE